MIRLAALFTTIGMGALGLPGYAEPLTMAKKAEVFAYDLQERFMLDGQLLCKLMLPTGDRTFAAYNMPDNAYMTGIHLGTLAWQFATTQDPEVRDRAGGVLDALGLLCTVSGKPGLLARAAWPADRPMADDGQWRPSADGRYRWRGDASSDQMTGVMFGFALAYDLFADEAQREAIRLHVAALCDHLLDNDLRIIGYDGDPTQWGNYTPTYVREREPMNALLLLQHLKVAAHVTNQPRFAEAYRRYAVDEGYAELAMRARRIAEPQRVNHSDDVLIFLAYVPLLELETDAVLRDRYLASLRRAWTGNETHPGIKPEGNPCYAFLAAQYLDDDSGIPAARDWLDRFPLDLKWNSNTISQYAEQFGFEVVPQTPSPFPGPGEPAPIDRREKTWSALVQNPYRAAGDRSVDGLLEYNGHDYLLAYWLGRRLGAIGHAN